MKRLALAAALVLAGCATTPAPAPAPAFDAGAAVAAIRAAGAALHTELDVQPLQDAAVADLREQAASDERAGRLDAAAAALDRALVEQPGDPRLLQERAEIAMLQHRPDEAAALARRAHAAGPRLGPLCRRSLETIVQVERIRASSGDAAGPAAVEAAVRERDACTLKPPPRY